MIDNEDIIRMAKEARMPYFYGTWEIANVDGLERFAALVAAHKRQWVGLTNQERNHIWRDFIGWGDPSHDDENLMKAIEGKLKEKNT